MGRRSRQAPRFDLQVGPSLAGLVQAEARSTSDLRGGWMDGAARIAPVLRRAAAGRAGAGRIAVHRTYRRRVLRRGTRPRVEAVAGAENEERPVHDDAPHQREAALDQAEARG